MVTWTGAREPGLPQAAAQDRQCAARVPRAGPEIWDDAGPAAQASGLRAAVGRGAGVCAGAAGASGEGGAERGSAKMLAAAAFHLSNRQEGPSRAVQFSNFPPGSFARLTP